MNNSIMKPKLKPFELGGTNENRGVRFMNKVRPPQKNPVSRSTVAPQSLLPQKNKGQNNENWRTNNNIKNMAKGNNTTGNPLSQSMYPSVKTTYNEEHNTTNKFGAKTPFINIPEDELKGKGKKLPPPKNARTSMYDFSNRGIRNNPLPKITNESTNYDRKAIHSDFNHKRGDNNNVNNLHPVQNSTTNSHIPKNVKFNNNFNTMNKSSVIYNTELDTNKSDTVQNAELFLSTYCSPIKRKMDTSDNHNANKNEEGITYEDLRTPKKRFAPRNTNVDNANMDYSKSVNVNNEKYYSDVGNKQGNNFMNSVAGTSENKELKSNKTINNINESVNSYNKFTNDNTPYGINSSVAVNGSSNFSEKKITDSRSRNDSVINSSYPLGNSVKKNEDFNTSSHNRNYTNYDRLKNNGSANLLNIHNAEIANKSHYMDKNKNKNYSEYKETFNAKNGDSNIFNSVNHSLMKPNQKNFNYVADTHSEKMMASSFRLPSSNNNTSAAAFDLHSDEQVKSYANRKVEHSGNDSLINNIHSNADAESNFMKSSIEKNASKMNSNNSKTINFIGTDMSNAKMSLMNSILDNSNGNMESGSLKPLLITSQSFAESSLTNNNNKEAVQEKNTRLKKKDIMNNTTSNKIDIEELKELVKNRKRINFETYEYNDKDVSYFKNVITDFPKYNSSDQDVDLLYKNVMNLNEYALNFQFENDRIDKFHNLTNAIKNKNKEAVDLAEKDLKRLDNILQDQNKEYDRLCLKLQESESMFCDINDETGEKKLKMCSEIDEKKNALRREYLKKKMSLDKNKYKLEKMKEDNHLERKGSIFTGNRFKRRYKLLESIFRIKVLKYDGNMLDLLLMPPNVQKHMWQRIQIERRAINPAFRKYLWSYVEAFSELKRWREYFKNN